MDWRRTLYDKYVSSGTGGGGGSDLYRPQAPYLRHVVKTHLPPDCSIHIVDLGCGAGALLYVLSELGYKNAVGVDFSPEMVEIAHRNGLKNVKLGDLQAELSNMADGSVDVVFVLDVLEHLDRQLLFDVSQQIRRVLKPGGQVIIHVPNAEGIFGGRIRYGDLTHELAFTSSSIRQLLRSVGFENISCHEDRPVVHGVKSSARWLVWWFGTLLFRLLFAAETGTINCILSQNLMATARVPQPGQETRAAN